MEENENKTFDDASLATEAMFNANDSDVPHSEEIQNEEQSIHAPNEAEPQAAELPSIDNQQSVEQLSDMPNTHNQQQNEAIEQIINQNEQLRAVNEELQKTIAQQSDMREDMIEEDIVPTLDFDALALDDEATRARKQAEFARQMAEYTHNRAVKELAPLIDYAKDGIRKNDREKVFSEIEKIPDMADIRQVAPQLERIIEKNPALFSDDVPMDDRYIVAYAIAKGANMLGNPPHEPSSDELMEYYDKNTDFQKMIESKRLEQIKNSQGQQVPPMAASSGAVNAALNIPDKPQTWEDASERTKKMFGI